MEDHSAELIESLEEDMADLEANKEDIESTIQSIEDQLENRPDDSAWRGNAIKALNASTTSLRLAREAIIRKRGEIRKVKFGGGGGIPGAHHKAVCDALRAKVERANRRTRTECLATDIYRNFVLEIDPNKAKILDFDAKTIRDSKGETQEETQ